MATLGKWYVSRVALGGSGWIPAAYSLIGQPVLDTSTGKLYVLLSDSLTFLIRELFSTANLATWSSSSAGCVAGGMFYYNGCLYAPKTGYSLPHHYLYLQELNLSTLVLTTKKTLVDYNVPAEGGGSGADGGKYAEFAFDGSDYLYAALGIAATGGLFDKLVRYRFSTDAVETLWTNPTRSKGYLQGIGLSGTNVYFVWFGLAAPNQAHYGSVPQSGGSFTEIGGSSDYFGTFFSGYKGWHLRNASGASILYNADESVSLAPSALSAATGAYLLDDEATLKWIAIASGKVIEFSGATQLTPVPAPATSDFVSPGGTVKILPFQSDGKPNYASRSRVTGAGVYCSISASAMCEVT